MANILVVDDEVKMCVILQGMLEERGHRVSTAGNGREAQELIAGQEFDVVVSDLKMSPVDGLELLQAVKKTSPDTEVVLMTAYASVQTAIQAMKQGAYDYIIKPFDLEEMGLLVDRILEKKRLVLENRQLREGKAPVSKVPPEDALREIIRQANLVPADDDRPLADIFADIREKMEATERDYPEKKNKPKTK